MDSALVKALVVTSIAARQAIVAVCRMPVDYARSTEWPGPSMAELLRRTRYVEHRAEIGEPELLAYVKENPSVIDDWLRLSGDQRFSPALCLLTPDETKRGQWTVVRIPGGVPSEFDSSFEAASHYIKRYVDHIAANDTFLNRIRARLWRWRHLRG